MIHAVLHGILKGDVVFRQEVRPTLNSVALSLRERGGVRAESTFLPKIFHLTCRTALCAVAAGHSPALQRRHIRNAIFLPILPVSGLPSPVSVPSAFGGTETTPDINVEEKVKEAFGRGWGVIVWNDPINLTHYVAHVFQVVLKMTLQVATKHMWEVHQKGKSMVAQETKEQAEFLVHRLQRYGLKTTMEPL
jgi:ATP-dependent Clp protease adaptor protein ClpS